MIRKTTFVVFESLATSALAEPIEVSCYWDAPSSHQTEPTVGELAKFYGKSYESAYFRFDVEAGSVAHNDARNTQSMVLPNLKWRGAQAILGRHKLGTPQSKSCYHLAFPMECGCQPGPP